MRRTLLIDEYPILVLPTLAEKIGLEEAIVLQQLHYWINNPKVGRFIDGRRWIKNSMEQWQTDNFKFIHMKTLRRVFERLKRDGLILLRSDLNHSAFDRTFWYSIDYEKLSYRCGQIDQMGVDNLTISLTETTSETTENTNTESSKEDSSSGDKSPALNQNLPEEEPLSTPLTIPHEVIPIPTPTPTPEEKKAIPTLQVELSPSPEGQILAAISAEPPKVEPKRRAKKAPKPKLTLYSHKELFDILLAFSFPGADPDAVMPLVGKLRKTLADYIYGKTNGEELSEERIERFLVKMRAFEGWYKTQHKDDSYRPKFPAPFMAEIGTYFGQGNTTSHPLKETVTCPTCNGAGGRVQKGSGKVSDTFALCPTCQGRGKVVRD
jgi:hypothetical protein